MTTNNPQISLDLLVRRRKNPEQVYRVLYWVNERGESCALERFGLDQHPKIKVCQVYGNLDRLTCDVDWETLASVSSARFWQTFAPYEPGQIEYLTYYNDERLDGVKRMYCTGLGLNSPLGGIGHQGDIRAAAAAPTLEDIRKVVAYLNEEIPRYKHLIDWRVCDGSA